MDYINFNENDTLEKMITDINNYLIEENKTDYILPEHLSNKIKYGNPFKEDEVKLLKGKRKLKIFNMIFKLNVTRNKINKKNWWQSDYLTTFSIENCNHYNLNRTYSDISNEFYSNIEEKKKNAEIKSKCRAYKFLDMLNQYNLSYDDFENLKFYYNDLNFDEQILAKKVNNYEKL